MVGSNLKIFIAAFGQSSIFRAVLLETNINVAAFYPAGCGIIGYFILKVLPGLIFWVFCGLWGFFCFCSCFFPPLFKMNDLISFRIGVSLEGKTPFKRELPDFKLMTAAL